MDFAFRFKKNPPSENFRNIFLTFLEGGVGVHKPNVKLTFSVASFSLDGSPYDE